MLIMKRDSLIFFVLHFCIPLYRARWGVVEVKEKDKTYNSVCVIAGEKLCVDVITGTFRSEGEGIKIHRAKKTSTPQYFVFTSRDGSVKVNVDKKFFNSKYGAPFSLK
jgi:hypothetical protein